MGRLFIATVSFLAAIIATILSFFIKINGNSAIEISTRLPVILTPASYSFIILILIYILLAYWLLNYWKSFKTSNNLTFLQTFLFVSANILVIVSIYFWHYLEFTMYLITIVLLLITLAALYFTYPYSDNKLTNRIPISILFAWFTIELMTNLYFVLTLNEWNGFGLSYPLWAVIALTFGTAIAMHVRYHYYDIAFPIVFIWAYIAVACHNGFDELLVTTASLFLSGVMLVGIIFMKKNPASQ